MNTTMAQYLAWIYSRTATVVPSHLEAIVSYLRSCQHFEALRTAISRSQQHQHCVLHRGSRERYSERKRERERWTEREREREIER